MEFSLFCLAIAKAIKTNSTLRKFLNQEFADVLSQLGKIQYQAAIRAFEDMQHTSNIEREISSAITLLRSAYEHFDSSIPKTELGLWFSWKVPEKRLNACEAAIMIAICYRLLGEQNLMIKYKAYAKQHFDNYYREQMDTIQPSVGNPTLYNGLLKPRIAEKQAFSALYAHI